MMLAGVEEEAADVPLGVDVDLEGGRRLGEATSDELGGAVADLLGARPLDLLEGALLVLKTSPEHGQLVGRQRALHLGGEARAGSRVVTGGELLDEVAGEGCRISRSGSRQCQGKDGGKGVHWMTLPSGPAPGKQQFASKPEASIPDICSSPQKSPSLRGLLLS